MGGLLSQIPFSQRVSQRIYKGKEKRKMKNCQNKWVRAAIPALLLHCSIGTVYGVLLVHLQPGDR